MKNKKEFDQLYKDMKIAAKKAYADKRPAGQTILETADVKPSPYEIADKFFGYNRYNDLATEPQLVASVEMGGMGEGYEHAIQKMAFGIILKCHENMPAAINYADESEDFRTQLNNEFDSYIFALDDQLGLGGVTGAMAGAAKNLAFKYLKDGHHETIRDMHQKNPDRLIRVSLNDIEIDGAKETSFWPD